MQEYELPSGEKVREVFAGYESKVQLKAAMDKRRTEVEAEGGKVVKREKIGRNDPCPCGSGSKFKRCCINKFEAGVAACLRVA